MTDEPADLVFDIAYALRFKAKLNGRHKREPDPRVIAAAVAEHLSLMWNFERKPPLAPWSIGLRVQQTVTQRRSEPSV